MNSLKKRTPNISPKPRNRTSSVQKKDRSESKKAKNQSSKSSKNTKLQKISKKVKNAKVANKVEKQTPNTQPSKHLKPSKPETKQLSKNDNNTAQQTKNTNPPKKVETSSSTVTKPNKIQLEKTHPQANQEPETETIVENMISTDHIYKKLKTPSEEYTKRKDEMIKMAIQTNMAVQRQKKLKIFSELGKHTASSFGKQIKQKKEGVLSGKSGNLSKN